MLSNLPKTAQTLLKAADIIRERGWCQNTLEDDDGHVCAVNAIILAGGLGSGASGLVRDFVGAGSLVGWNNAPERTAEEVIAAFENTAASVASSSVAAEG